MKELAKTLEIEWMKYNAAVVERLHPEEAKKRLANIVINNMTDILKALNAYDDTPKGTVVTGDMEPPKRVRKSGER